MSDKQKEIIISFAKNDMNISRTAKDLYYSNASIHYHFAQIKQRTGLDPRRFYDLLKLIQKTEVLI